MGKHAAELAEKDIQSILTGITSGFSTYNSYAFGWESDLLVVRPNLMSWEFEIKVTRADFFRDFTHKVSKHSILLDSQCPDKPNRFYYACPFGMVDVKDIPPYAGLVYINEKIGDWVNPHAWVKTAPLLHREPISAKRLYQIASSLSYRRKRG